MRKAEEKAEEKAKEKVRRKERKQMVKVTEAKMPRHPKEANALR
jgi:hypothetical protein